MNELPDAATNVHFSPGKFVEIKNSIKNQKEKKEESREDIGNDKKKFNLLVKITFVHSRSIQVQNTISFMESASC